MPLPLLLIGIAAASGAVGIGSGASGAKKMSKANALIKEYSGKYEDKKEALNTLEDETTKTLEQLGKLKLDIWKSFDAFAETFEKIKNKPVIDGCSSEDKFRLPKHELDEIKAISVTAVEVLGSGTSAAGSGALAGLAVYGGVMKFGIASTGTAISTLSGAAATKATLAALGGGAIKAGGLGMAGGTAVLGGLVMGPALAVGGLLMAAKGKASEKKAEEVKEEVNKAIRKMNEAIRFLRLLLAAATEMNGHLKTLQQLYAKKLQGLQRLVARNADYNAFTIDDKRALEHTILLVKLLKQLTTLDIIVKSKGKQTVDEDRVAEAIETTRTQVREVGLVA